jgi:hypothetical protein
MTLTGREKSPYRKSVAVGHEERTKGREPSQQNQQVHIREQDLLRRLPGQLGPLLDAQGSTGRRAVSLNRRAVCA